MGYNMSYCQFQNTSGALSEAMSRLQESEHGDFNIGKECSTDELKAMRHLFVDMLTEHLPNVFGIEIDDVEDIVDDIDKQIAQAILTLTE